MEGVTVVGHPLVQHKLTLLREKDLSSRPFRELCRELGMLLCYEVTRDLPLDLVEDRDASETHQGAQDRRQKAGVCADPALRPGPCGRHAGAGSAARVAHIGLYRDPGTLVAVEYYLKTPTDLAERMAIVVSPVIATANTAVAAVDRLKERGARSIRMVCMIAAPEGLRASARHSPRRSGVDRGDRRSSNEQAFIVPGLGDAGNRAYGTE